MKKILIALDYDTSAQKVAESGYLLAKTMGAKVFLLHVIRDSTYYSVIEHVKILGFAGHMDTNKEPTKKTIDPKRLSQEFLNKSKIHLGDDSIETIIREGDSAESILKTVKEMQADFIIMGSHSRKWFENIAIGSVTERVLLNIRIPIIIIPTKQR